MLLTAIGVLYGGLVGLFGNWMLFHKMARNRRNGVDSMDRIGSVFLIRYAVDVVGLFAFGFLVRHTGAIIAAALSVTVAVKISLFTVFRRKGGRFD